VPENRKKIFFVFIVFWSTLCLTSLLGDSQPISKTNPITAVGTIKIPGAEQTRAYAARFRVSAGGLEIICKEKIFRRFNEFNTPFSTGLKIETSELREIALRKKDLLIFTSAAFYTRYRNLFHLTIEFKGYYAGTFHSKERPAIIFSLEDDAAVQPFLAALKSLLKPVPPVRQ